ncbi:sugar ABC transporter substrate-binding protein [Jiangella endophytica]|uniref:sugar ABC transporter substrate-binding protein n=1 Tax=Jiangella endophytica TaxID=1623398 RepID=UPI000E34FFF4|nr:substrate-binding domain-containing protein [Jiangella endophytica]
MARITFGAGLAVLAALVLAACSEQPAADTDVEAASAEETPVPVDFLTVEPGSGEGLRVGYISANEAVPVNHQYTESVREYAGIAGIELVVCDAEGQASTALDCARRFSALDLDAYFLYQLTVSAAESICAAGPDVPVIGLNFPQKPCEEVNIRVDNFEAGRLGGEALGRHIEESFDCEYDLYVSIELSMLGDANTQRMGGFREGFASVCGEITDERTFEALTPTEARDAFRDLLSSVPTAERIMVVGVADYAVLGAHSAAQAASREDDVFFAGQALDSSAVCELATNPNFITSVAYFPERLGEVAIPYLLQVLDGEELPGAVLGTPVEVANAANVGDLYDTTGC